MTTQPADVPIACTLDPGEQPDRLAEWRGVLDRAKGRAEMADGALRIDLGDDEDMAELTRLVVAEQRCCAFFSFAITVDRRGPALEVQAPMGAADAVGALFGLTHGTTAPTSVASAASSTGEGSSPVTRRSPEHVRLADAD